MTKFWPAKAAVQILQCLYFSANSSRSCVCGLRRRLHFRRYSVALVCRWDQTHCLGYCRVFGCVDRHGNHHVRQEFLIDYSNKCEGKSAKWYQSVCLPLHYPESAITYGVLGTIPLFLLFLPLEQLTAESVVTIYTLLQGKFGHTESFKRQLKLQYLIFWRVYSNKNYFWIAQVN